MKNSITITLGGKVFPTIAGSGYRHFTRRIFTFPFDIPVCPFCNRKTMAWTMVVPVAKDRAVRVEVAKCNACDVFFSSHDQMMSDLKQKTTAPEELEIDRKYENEVGADNMKLHLSEIPFSICKMIVSSSKGLQVYIIVASKMETIGHPNMLEYRSDLALELITAAALNESFVTIDGERCFVHSAEINQDNPSLRVLSPGDSLWIYQQKNGGFYQPNTDLIDATGLVFCHRSNRYEPLRVSYEKEHPSICYVDRRWYASFFREKGAPTINHEWIDTGYHRTLNDESTLYAMGYNVNQQNGLTSLERQMIISEAIESGVMQPSAICNLLESLILRNGKNKPHAARAWSEDLDYTLDYRYDPQRLAFIKTLMDV